MELEWWAIADTHPNAEETLMENVEICMGRKSIRIHKPSNDGDRMVELDVADRP